MNEYAFGFRDIVISREDFYPFIKNEDGSVNTMLDDFVGDILHKAPDLTKLWGGYIVSDISPVTDSSSILVASQVFNTGKVVYSRLRKSEKAAIFVCTAGKEISDWSKEENKKGDPLMSYLIDLAGSIIVEAVVDRLQDIIEQDALCRGFKITNRYSPGYCSWNVSEQKKLFSLFPENFSQISLTDSSLMQPIKSVSGIIGLGKEVRKMKYSCSFCTQENCMFSEKEKRK